MMSDQAFIAALAMISGGFIGYLCVESATYAAPEEPPVDYFVVRCIENGSHAPARVYVDSSNLTRYDDRVIMFSQRNPNGEMIRYNVAGAPSLICTAKPMHEYVPEGVDIKRLIE